MPDSDDDCDADTDSDADHAFPAALSGSQPKAAGFAGGYLNRPNPGCCRNRYRLGSLLNPDSGIDPDTDRHYFQLPKHSTIGRHIW
jgi:hypothetical protein